MIAEALALARDLGIADRARRLGATVWRLCELQFRERDVRLRLRRLVERPELARRQRQRRIRETLRVYDQSSPIPRAAPNPRLPFYRPRRDPE